MNVWINRDQRSRGNRAIVLLMSYTTRLYNVKPGSVEHADLRTSAADMRELIASIVNEGTIDEVLAA